MSSQLAQFEIPQRIGPYRLLDVLGRGGMGVVYRGEHLETRELVAVKTVPAAAESMLSAIRREIHALSLIRHPGVVRIVEQGVVAGLPWYAMDLLVGRTLRSRLDQLWAMANERSLTMETRLAPADLAAVNSDSDTITGLVEGGPAWLRPSGGGHALKPVLSIIRRLCAPLSFLHGKGLVHRDLKPDNIFIRDSGTPVLVDFGIASRAGAGREVLEVGGQVVGTRAYIAPEQIRGEYVDARADLYALGCILYEWVTGHPPFGGPHLLAVFDQHLHHTPVRPSLLVDSVPPKLEALIMRLLEKLPQHRLGHAGDVAAALADLGAEDWDGQGAPVPRAAAYLYRPAFVGNEHVLGRLKDAVELAKKRVGGRVFVGGESGVGKTRLAMELAVHAMRRKVHVITGECMPVGVVEREGDGALRAAPLHPFRQLLLAVADRCREKGLSETDRLLGARGRVLAAYEPSLADLPGQGDMAEPLEAAAARARVHGALKETLFALAETTPLLLILDDLQWADELSLGFLKSLRGGELATCGVLIVATYRMEETSAALAELLAADVERLEMERCDAATVRAMVAGMLALSDPPPRLVDFLVTESRGNPFLVAEYLRAAIGEGLILRDATGRWQLEELAGGEGQALAQLLPRSLAELIDTRLASLGPESRELVQLASVLGRDFDGELLADASGLGDAEMLGAVDELRTRNILEEAGAGNLRFVHPKLREITYEKIAAPARRDLHRRAVSAMEVRFRGTAELDRLCPSLAHHASCAELHDKAVTWFMRAGDRAKAAWSNDEAIAAYRAARSHLAALLALAPDDAAGWREIGAGLRERLGDVLSLTNRHDEAAETYAEAIAWTAPRECISLARLHRKIGKLRETHHRHDEALRLYGLAEDALDDLPSDATAPSWWAEWVQIQIDRLSVHYWLANLNAIRGLVEYVRPALEDHGTPLERTRFLQALVLMNLRAERHVASRETVAWARACAAAAEQSGGESELSNARFGLACVLVFHGALEEGEARMSATFKKAERTGDITLQSRCLTYLALIHRLLGRVEETARVAERGLDVATRGQMVDYIGAARAQLAWVAWREDKRRAAEEHARAAIGLWHTLPYVYPLQWLARLPLAEILQGAGATDEAIDHLRALIVDVSQQKLPVSLESALSAAMAPGLSGHLQSPLFATAFDEARRLRLL